LFEKVAKILAFPAISLSQAFLTVNRSQDVTQKKRVQPRSQPRAKTPSLHSSKVNELHVLENWLLTSQSVTFL
jgi:hypothetical protein